MIMPMDEHATGHDASDSEGLEAKFYAKRYAVKFEPPCIFLEYEEDKTRKRRVRAVKLTHVDIDMDTDKLTRKVIRSFPRKLVVQSVKYDQVRKLVARLLEHASSRSSCSCSCSSDCGSGLSLSSGTSAAFASKLPALQLPGLGGDSTLQPIATDSPRIPGHVSKQHPLHHLLNSSRAGEVNVSTDSRFSISPSSSPGGQRESEAGDDLDTALADLDQELDTTPRYSSRATHFNKSVKGSPQACSCPSTTSPSTPCPACIEQLGSPSRPAGSHGSSTPQGPSQGRQGDSGSRPALLGPAEEREGLTRKSRFAQAAESQVLELEVAAEVDLNKVTEVELALAKKRMEQDFNKNRLKPGDPGFEYDKQVDFGPATEDNDWDD